MSADEFNWAEIAPPGFEVHSKQDKTVNSMNNPYLMGGIGQPQALVDAIMRYVHNFPHVR